MLKIYVRVARESLTEEILFKSKSKGNKKVYHLNFWGKAFQAEE